MASASIKKCTTQSLKELRKHYDLEMRKETNHSNTDIDKAKTYLNYNLTCQNGNITQNITWIEIEQGIQDEIERIDAITPPKRLRTDRKTNYILEVVCPKEIEAMGREDEFFEKAYQAYDEMMPGSLVGAQVHKDEKHIYIDSGNVKRESLYHMDMFGVPNTKAHGINMKIFMDQAKIIQIQDTIQKITIKEFGISYNTGESPQKKSVEEMKIDSSIQAKKNEMVETTEQLECIKDEVKNLDNTIKHKTKKAEEIITHAEGQAENIVQQAYQRINELNVLDEKTKKERIQKESQFKKYTNEKHRDMFQITSALQNLGQLSFQDPNKAVLKILTFVLKIAINVIYTELQNAIKTYAEHGDFKQKCKLFQEIPNDEKYQSIVKCMTATVRSAVGSNMTKDDVKDLYRKADQVAKEIIARTTADQISTKMEMYQFIALEANKYVDNFIVSKKKEAENVIKEAHIGSQKIKIVPPPIDKKLLEQDLQKDIKDAKTEALKILTGLEEVEDDDYEL